MAVTNIDEMTPDAELRWLNSEEACRMLSPSARRKRGKRLRATKAKAELDVELAWAIVLVSLYRFACSEPWAMAIRDRLSAVGMLSRSAPDNAKAAQRQGIYPPRVERTGWGIGHRVCCDCGVSYPPNNCRSYRGDVPGGWVFICETCAEGDNLERDRNRNRSVLIQHHGGHEV